jgi:AcrR family transcriptional regulator
VPKHARKRTNTSAVAVRDRLLDAADRLFYQEGVRAVGIDRLLAEADAAKASLYQHFGCKDQLVASYLERKTADARAHIERYLADTPPSQRALKFFDWVVDWAESKDFRGCPLQHTVSELTDAAHPARAIAHGQREWFSERFLEWATAAGLKDAKATARALIVLFDGAVAGSEVDGPQRAKDARWMARRLLGGAGLDSTNEPGSKGTPAVTKPNRHANRKRGENQQTAPETYQPDRRP